MDTLTIEAFGHVLDGLGYEVTVTKEAPDFLSSPSLPSSSKTYLVEWKWTVKVKDRRGVVASWEGKNEELMYQWMGLCLKGLL